MKDTDFDAQLEYLLVKDTHVDAQLGYLFVKHTHLLPKHTDFFAQDAHVFAEQGHLFGRKAVNGCHFSQKRGPLSIKASRRQYLSGEIEIESKEMKVAHNSFK